MAEIMRAPDIGGDNIESFINTGVTVGQIIKRPSLGKGYEVALTPAK